MRFVLLGNDTGNGKTLSSIYLLLMYYRLGFDIYSNIKLKGELKNNYTFIDGSKFIDEFKDSQTKKAILLDEIGQSTYGHTTSSVEMSNVLSQSRKSIGENSHLIANTQMDIQLNPIWRGLTDYFIYPQIKLIDNKEMPMICYWYIEKKIKGFHGGNYMKKIRFKKLPMILIKDICKVMNLYDTHIETDKFKSDRVYTQMKKKYKKMKGKDGMTSNFKAILINEEGLNPTEADRIARSIIHAV